jgi:feruloyl esterase
MSSTHLVVATAVAASVAFGAHVRAQQQGEGGSSATVTTCAASAVQQKAPQGTTITDAKVVEANGSQRRHCQVDGHVTVPGNAVNFRVGLPENWNGKFLFVGVGGLAGQLGNLRQGLERGYATATTDTGHLASDPNWSANRAKEVDYGHRGTHVTTVASKALTEAFYEKPLQRAYFNGCSNGGRQALMEVQRYPSDFDGIIAGDPATGTPMQVARGLVFQKMLASSDAYLPQAKVELLSKATLDMCDASDGLKDGLISDPRTCTFKPEMLRCKSGDAPTCLSAKQLDVVNQIYGGVKLSSGDTYAYGFPAGHEGGATGWQAWINGSVPPTKQADGTLAFTEKLPSGYQLSDSNFRFLTTDEDDPSFGWRTLNLERDLPRLKVMTDILSPLDPDLRPFKARGGKLLLYHGWADPAISALGTLDYWSKVGKVVGSSQELASFVSLYLIPGMHHCTGGPGPNEFDMLTVLENWSEKGTTPGPVVATHKTDGKVDRTRPLCPRPQVATYSGTGSIDDAANFRCQVLAPPTAAPAPRSPRR